MPQVGLHKGCCLDYLTNTKLVFDSFVTSPPYNVGMNYEGCSDSKSRVEYLRFMTLVARLSIQSAHEKTVFWLQLGPNRKDPQLPYDVLECFQYEGWTLVNQIVWLKSGTFPQLDGTEASFGHFRPIQSPTILHRGWEWVFMLTAEPKSGVKLDKLALGVPYKDQSNVKRFNHDQNLRCRGDVWFVPPENEPHKVSLMDAAWLACALDSEGSIYIAKSNDSRKASPGYQLVVDLSNTHKGYIDKARSIVGDLGNVTSKPARLADRFGSEYSLKECFRATWVGKQAAAVLRLVRPFLVIKQRQADLGYMLDSSKASKYLPGYKVALTPEVLEFREKCHATMKLLNDGGAPDMGWVTPLNSLPERADCDSWFVPYDTRQKQPHPCAFPVALAENCLKLQGLEPGSLVCDPFCGTGATLRAAVQLGHHAEGCEISKTYHDWTLKDLQKLGYLVHSS